MSKNIVIQEGGVGRQFTADKLTTTLVGGGSCNWVPEDEIQLGTKYISENGVYVAADDGEYGYSQVNVNVNSPTKIITGSTDDGEPVVTTIDVVDGTISEIILGDYFIVTYDGDGNVAKIEDNNGNRCLLTYDGETLSGFDDIEDNHYTIILDSNGNISQVIDPNAQDCELRDSDGDGKIDIISVGAVLEVVPDIETGDIKIIDENDNDVTDDYIGTSITGVDSNDTQWRANITDSTSGEGASMDITPVIPASTPGASISGIDSDGDESVVGIANDGSLEMEKIPSSIKVITPPNKVIYEDGEIINSAGMVVKAYLLSGGLWTPQGYPDGVIPLSKLTLSPKKADLSKSEGGSAIPPEGLDVTDISSIEFGSAFAAKWRNMEGLNVGRYYEITASPQYSVLANGRDLRGFSLSPDGLQDYYYRNWHVTEQPGPMVAREAGLRQTTTLISGTTVYWVEYTANAGHSVKPYEQSGTPPRVDMPNNTEGFRIYLTAIFDGTITYGGQNIDVIYNRSPDNVPLTDTFKIQVRPGEGGGGGGGGDEGGGDSPVPEGITVQDLNIAIYNAMNAGQDHIEIDGQQYTIAEAQAMIDYLISH